MSMIVRPDAYKMKFLTGCLVLKPVTYRYIDLGNGQGQIETDFSSLGPVSHEDAAFMLCQLHSMGEKFTMPLAPLSTKLPWWRRLWQKLGGAPKNH